MLGQEGLSAPILFPLRGVLGQKGLFPLLWGVFLLFPWFVGSIRSLYNLNVGYLGYLGCLGAVGSIVNQLFTSLIRLVRYSR